MNVDPRGFRNAAEWCEATMLPLGRLTLVPFLQDPEQWKEWAYLVIQSPKISDLAPPDPRYFDDWRDWAFRFNQAVPL